MGMWILLLHDVCDPLIHGLKIAEALFKNLPVHISDRESKLFLLKVIQDICGLLLIVTWILCRLYLFPSRLMYAFSVSSSLHCRYSIGFTCSSLFFVLMIMHFLWFYLIFKLVLIRIFHGKWKDTTYHDGSDSMGRNSHNKTQ